MRDPTSAPRSGAPSPGPRGARGAPTAIAAIAAALLLVPACASAPPPPDGPPPPLVLRAPHWDQVCRLAPEPTPLLSLDEAIERSRLPSSVLTLHREAGPSGSASGTPEASGGPGPSVGAPDVYPLPPPVPAGLEPARLPAGVHEEGTHEQGGRHLDVGFRFDPGGRLGAVGVLESGFPERTARPLAGRVVAALRPPPALLEPVRGRIRIEDGGPGRTLRARLLDPVDCLPHLPHPGIVPTREIPGGVEVVAGTPAFCRPGEACLHLTVRVDAAGRVRGVERRAGDEVLFERVRAHVRALVFDPALRNGEPVEGEVPLTLRPAAR